MCVRCSHPSEDDIHIFSKCDFAVAAWKAVDFSPAKLLDRATSWLHMLELIRDEPNSATVDLGKVIICLWGLWRARNKVIFTNQKIQPKNTLENALCFLEAFLRGQENLQEPLVHKTEHPSRWFPPNDGWIMLNTDVSFSTTGAGYDFVLRDHYGAVLKSGAGPMVGIISADHGELMAVEEFSLVQEYWDMPLILATDCQRLVS